MKVRYTRRAARQLDAILDYIEERSPKGPRKVMDRIEAALELLAEHPNAGQTTDRGGARRLVAQPYPMWFSIASAGPRLSFTAFATPLAASRTKASTEGRFVALA